MRVWVTAAVLSLQASLSQATDLPRAVTPSDFPPQEAELLALGRDLFFDPLLSQAGSCASCHHPALGPTGRHASPHGAPARTPPRDTPSLANLGAYDTRVLLQDGAVAAEAEAPFGIRLPRGHSLERPVPSPLVALMLVTIDAGATARIAALPGYADRFAAYTGPRPLQAGDIARALAAHVGEAFRTIDSPFDAYLRGDRAALSDQQQQGMALFYGAAGCSGCHAGPFQTDQGFHALGLPPVAGGIDPGRGGVTGAAEDLHRFRTPSLRNVAFTAPYGHNGAYPTLRSMLHHHLDPMAALAAASAQDTDPARLTARMALAEAIELAPVALEPAQVDAILAFLLALGDPAALTGPADVPDTVPSGRPVR